MNFKRALPFISALLIVLTMSHPAQADQYDAFFQIVCDKESQTVTIKIPYPHKKADREQMVKDIYAGKIKDGYAFSALAKSGEKVACDMGDEHTISFEAFKSKNHPHNDNIEMFIDGKHSPVWFQTLPLEGTINFTSPDDYLVKDCTLWPKKHPPADGSNCKDEHVVNGRRVEDYPKQQE